MTIINALVCTGIFILVAMVIIVPSVILYFALKAVINWTKWFIKVHSKFDDDWYNL